ncbi:MAG TPA: hypothetical protein VLB84_19155 [Bacteroidia bacterium]|nr:hypothetical protein [Bacteroidia bacterium]
MKKIKVFTCPHLTHWQVFASWPQIQAYQEQNIPSYHFNNPELL